MKKIYTILSVLLIGTQLSNAQLTLTKALYEPVVGDVQREVSYDSTTAIPKNMGAGQNWNFTTFTLGPGSYSETVTFTTTASVAQSSLCPGATIVGDRGSGKYDFLKSSGSTFEFAGQYDPSPSSMVFSNTANFFTWPISMGYTNSDNFSGVISGSSGTVGINGTVTHSATGTGTVTLPSGNVHNNCLQYIERVMFTLTQGTVVVQTQDQVKYSYFSSSMKQPIAELQYSSQTSGTTTTVNTDMMFNKDALTVGINEYAGAKTDFIVYPNPATDHVNVILPNKETPSSIEVIDVLGRTITSSVNSTSVVTNSLTKGVYSIRVKSKGVIGTKSLVITE
jgi:hypothetical protein